MDHGEPVSQHVSRRHMLQILAALGITGAAADQLAASAAPTVSPEALRGRPTCSRAVSTRAGCGSRRRRCSATSISCRSCASWSCPIASSPHRSSRRDARERTAAIWSFSPRPSRRALLRTRQVSPVELVEAYLARIAAIDPKVNAFITVTADRARDEARRAEQAIARGDYRGPLHGIPYAPKDILATRGIRTTNGSKVTAGLDPRHRVHDHRAAQRPQARS